MDVLKQKFYDKSSALRTEIRAMSKESGSQVVDQVNIGQIIGGMRGIKSILWETSELDATVGIRFRGYSIPELKELLPKKKDGREPLPEGLFWLMLVDEIPTAEETAWLSDEWEKRAKLPKETIKVLDALDVFLCFFVVFKVLSVSRVVA